MDDRHLIAPEGMRLTNGDIIVSELWLGDGDTSIWRLITEEEAIEFQRVKEEEYVNYTN